MDAFIGIRQGQAVPQQVSAVIAEQSFSENLWENAERSEAFFKVINENLE